MGLRGRDLVNNVGKVMLQGGGTFGTFMGKKKVYQQAFMLLVY